MLLMYSTATGQREGENTHSDTTESKTCVHTLIQYQLLMVTYTLTRILSNTMLSIYRHLGKLAVALNIWALSTVWKTKVERLPLGTLAVILSC